MKISSAALSLLNKIFNSSSTGKKLASWTFCEIGAVTKDLKKLILQQWIKGRGNVKVARRLVPGGAFPSSI
jgi:hypothetical protein